MNITLYLKFLKTVFTNKKLTASVILRKIQIRKNLYSGIVKHNVE